MKVKPTPWIIAVVICLAGAGAWHVSQRAATTPADPLQLHAESPATGTVADVMALPPAAAGAPDTIDAWIADANGGDAGKRASAIAALGNAPRAQAVPVLARVLTDGEPVVDRPLALSSLRELALEQGDADGAIRNAIRAVIYHGDDHTALADVQDTLDVIEESEMK